MRQAISLAEKQANFSNRTKPGHEDSAQSVRRSGVYGVPVDIPIRQQYRQWQQQHVHDGNRLHSRLFRGRRLRRTQ